MTLVLHSRVDPTRTGHIVRAFDRALFVRFKKLRDAIVQSIVEDDDLALEGTRWNARKFDFPRSDKKISAFMRWLNDQASRGILEIAPGTSMEQAAAKAWSNVYIRSAYQKGLATSAKSLRKAGAQVADSWVEGAFFRPIHADSAGILYTRSFSELKGVTDQMGTRMSRVLSKGIIEGTAPRALAKVLVDEVGFGLTRAKTIARTETIFAHAESTLNVYEEARVLDVEIESEFATARDNRVCPKCASLEGRRYTIPEARGILPVHPNCRCAWLPVVSDLPRGVKFI